jgi:hypothetical protein
MSEFDDASPEGEEDVPPPQCADCIFFDRPPTGITPPPNITEAERHKYLGGSAVPFPGMVGRGACIRIGGGELFRPCYRVGVPGDPGPGDQKPLKADAGPLDLGDANRPVLTTLDRREHRGVGEGSAVTLLLQAGFVLFDGGRHIDRQHQQQVDRSGGGRDDGWPNLPWPHDGRRRCCSDGGDKRATVHVESPPAQSCFGGFVRPKDEATSTPTTPET